MTEISSHSAEQPDQGNEEVTEISSHRTGSVHMEVDLGGLGDLLAAQAADEEVTEISSHAIESRIAAAAGMVLQAPTYAEAIEDCQTYRSAGMTPDEFAVVARYCAHLEDFVQSAENAGLSGASLIAVEIEHPSGRGTLIECDAHGWLILAASEADPAGGEQ